jgi:hypothetical protein
MCSSELRPYLFHIIFSRPMIKVSYRYRWRTCKRCYKAKKQSMSTPKQPQVHGLHVPSEHSFCPLQGCHTGIGPHFVACRRHLPGPELGHRTQNLCHSRGRSQNWDPQPLQRWPGCSPNSNGHTKIPKSGTARAQFRTPPLWGPAFKPLSVVLTLLLPPSKMGN